MFIKVQMMTELLFLLACYDGENILQIKLEDMFLRHMVIAQVLQHPQQLMVPLVSQHSIIQDSQEM